MGKDDTEKWRADATPPSNFTIDAFSIYISISIAFIVIPVQDHKRWSSGSLMSHFALLAKKRDVNDLGDAKLLNRRVVSCVPSFSICRGEEE